MGGRERGWREMEEPDILNYSLSKQDDPSPIFVLRSTEAKCEAYSQN